MCMVSAYRDVTWRESVMCIVRVGAAAGGGVIGACAVHYHTRTSSGVRSRRDVLYKRHLLYVEGSQFRPIVALQYRSLLESRHASNTSATTMQNYTMETTLLQIVLASVMCCLLVQVSGHSIY